MHFNGPVIQTKLERRLRRAMKGLKSGSRILDDEPLE